MIPKLVDYESTRGFQTNSIYYRIVKAWNELPRAVKHTKNIKQSDSKKNNLPANLNFLQYFTAFDKF